MRSSGARTSLADEQRAPPGRVAPAVPERRHRRGRRAVRARARARRRRRRARGERPGGRFDVTDDVDASTATPRSISSAAHEFIFDVQSHYVNYDQAPELGEWTAIFPGAGCAEGVEAGSAKACFTADAYFREMFVRSDTSMAILSALPTSGHDRPQLRRHGLRDRRRDPHRVQRPRAHARRRVPAPRPDRARARGHDRAARQVRHRGLEDLHDGADRRALLLRRPRQEPSADRPALHRSRPRDRAARSSARTRASRRSSDPRPSSPIPSDIGPAAKRNPDVNFVVYHSGFEPSGGGVGPYDPNDPRRRASTASSARCEEAGIEPNSNVYAELGGTWWFLMRDPHAGRARARQAAEVRRRGARALGHRLDLVRHAAGPDPGDAHVPDRRASCRKRTATRRSRRTIKAGIFGLNAAALYGIEPITGSCELIARAKSRRSGRRCRRPRTYGPGDRGRRRAA